MEGPVVGRASSPGPPPELVGEVRRLQACIDERDGWIQGWRQQCDTLRLEKETDARAHGAQCRMLSASLATASDSCCTLASQLAKAKEETAAAAIERVALDQRHATQTALCASADEHIRRANSAYVDLQAKHTAARDTVLRLTGQLEQANRPVSISPALATVEGPAPAPGPLAGPGPALTDDGPADFGQASRSPPLSRARAVSTDSLPPMSPGHLDNLAAFCALRNQFALTPPDSRSSSASYEARSPRPHGATSPFLSAASGSPSAGSPVPSSKSRSSAGSV